MLIFNFDKKNYLRLLSTRFFKRTEYLLKCGR